MGTSAYKHLHLHLHLYHTDELYSGIANGRVLTVELYAHRNQKSIFLHLFTELFHKDISFCFIMKSWEISL